MGYHYDYDSILTAADKIETHPETGKKLSEHVAHDEFEFPVYEEHGLPLVIALFRQVDVEVPAHRQAEQGEYFLSLSEYLCCLDELHDLTTQDEEDILHDLCLATEMNLKDIEKVRHFYACKNR